MCACPRIRTAAAACALLAVVFGSTAPSGGLSARGPTVVLPDSPTAVERSAAKELADGLEKCLGKRPEIVAERDIREGRAAVRPYLFVGATRAAAVARAAASARPPYQVSRRCS